jgi:parallel beta-helix repeat protein
MIKNNTDGIQMYKVYYNNIYKNNFSNNDRYGVYLGYDSQHNNVTFNTFMSNDKPVLLSKNSAFLNDISWNTLIDNEHEIDECCGAEGRNIIINNVYKN